MVFCGPPSKACLACRQRRIKCDHISPACSQCLRAGKKCTGYRDQVALMFRDENEKVFMKSINSSRTNKQRNSCITTQRIKVSPKTTRASADKDASVRASNATTQLTTYPFSAPQDDAGFKFFFKHYVGVVSKFPDGKPDLLSSPAWHVFVANTTIFKAASAVGFAGLTNLTSDPQYRIVAQQRYVSSIQEIKNMLRHGSLADLDIAFKTVMVLATFEIVNCNTTGTSSWGIHIEGGTAIMRMIQNRYYNKLPTSQQMQVQFLFTVFAKCVLERESPPAFVLVLKELYEKSMDTDAAHVAPLIEMIFRVVTLCATTINLQAGTSGTILREALLLDQQLENWKAHLPRIWCFTTESADDLEYTYKGQTHTYRDMSCAESFNNYRWARIVLNQLILVHLDELGSSQSEKTDQWIKSAGLITEIASDLCTSVSSILRRYGVLETLRYGLRPMSGSFSLLFPLAIAASAMEVSEDLHHWAIEILEGFGRKMGISQALTMIPFIRLQRENWLKGTGILNFQFERLD